MHLKVLFISHTALLTQPHVTGKKMMEALRYTHFKSVKKLNISRYSSGKKNKLDLVL